MTANPASPLPPGAAPSQAPAASSRPTEWRGLDHEAVLGLIAGPAAIVVRPGGHSGAARARIVAANAPFDALLGGSAIGLPLDRVAPAEVLVGAEGGTGLWRRLGPAQDPAGLVTPVEVVEVEWRITALAEGMQLLAAQATHISIFEETARALRAAHPEFMTAAGILLDERGRVVALDPLAEALLGPTTRWLDRDLSELEPDLAGRWGERRDELGRGLVRFETRLCRDGLNLDVAVLGKRFKAGGRDLYLELLRDLGEERPLRAAYGDLAQRFELIEQAANDGLWFWDLATGEVEYSPRWAAIMGHAEARLVGTIEVWLERVHPLDRPAVDEALGAHLDGDAPFFEVEHRVEHRSGHWRWVLVRGLAERDARGQLRLMAGSVSDVTHRRNADERLRYEAFHDSLTGLANRAWLIHRLHDALLHARSSDEHFALVQIGVDGFKLVNDSLGLSLGDMLLRAIAARIARSVRANDTVARIGGDEFVLLLEGLDDPSQVTLVTDRIARDLAQPFDLRGYSVYSSASMGIVPSGASYSEPEELLRDANIALVRAKRAGRAKRVVFDESMRHETIRRLTLETDLRRALERAELRLVYQPVVSLQTGALLGFEALCRWQHNKHGLIGPNEFIPIAEDSGLIMPIGQWALQTACEDALGWPEVGGRAPWVAVNVSGRQLAQPGFVADVKELLARYEIAPERLHLEITESVLMENAESSRELLEGLRQLGLGLSIDDFGTGYSSLAYLRRFPVETIKIDRAFLAKEADTEDGWAIIQTIRSLAEILGLAVVVEGIETRDHLERLRAMGCQAGQGYLVCRPIPADEVDLFIAGLSDGRVLPGS